MFCVMYRNRLALASPHEGVWQAPRWPKSEPNCRLACDPVRQTVFTRLACRDMIYRLEVVTLKGDVQQEGVDRHAGGYY